MNMKNSIPWWMVIAAMVLSTPVGIVLLVVKLISEGQHRTNGQRQDFTRNTNYSRNNTETQHSSSANRANSTAQNANAVPPSFVRKTAQNSYSYNAVYNKGNSSSTSRNLHREQEQNPVNSDARPMPGKNAGQVLTIVGAIVAAIAAIFLMSGANAAMYWFPFTQLSYLRWAIQDSFAAMSIGGAGVCMFLWGRFKNRQAKRFCKALKLIGKQKKVDVRQLADAMSLGYKKTCTMLENMIDDGYLGEAYLNLGTGMLVLDGSGMEQQPREPEKKQEPQSDEDKDKAILAEIRRINDAIPDPELTRKIYRIEEITGHILAHQKKHPEKASQLRTFLNYYLPTTLKILNAYAELDRQGVDGTNISATKKRIEGMLDLVVEGFETQLDKLFEGEMMDITSDISVMEQMLSRDGLSANGDFTMHTAPEAPQPAAPTEQKTVAEPSYSPELTFESAGFQIPPQPEDTPMQSADDIFAGIQLTLNPEEQEQQMPDFGGGSAVQTAPLSEGEYHYKKEDLN